MERVVITRPWLGLIAMQVCAVKDATDEEILTVCNTKNPAGTINGWTNVIRTVDDAPGISSENTIPVQCDKDAERLHFIVLC